MMRFGYHDIGLGLHYMAHNRIGGRIVPRDRATHFDAGISQALSDAIELVLLTSDFDIFRSHATAGIAGEYVGQCNHMQQIEPRTEALCYSRRFGQQGMRRLLDIAHRNQK
jgi:hypothetical protein